MPPLTPLRIGLVTVDRSDDGHLQPIFARLRAHPDCVPVWIPWPSQTDGTPEGVAREVAAAIGSFSGRYGIERLDWVLVMGDRVEQFAAAMVATIHQLPIAHLHGGETTRGAMDNQFRHAITKLAHLHFTSAVPHLQRVISLGEEPWRVFVTGCARLEGAADVARERVSGQAHVVGILHPETLVPEDLRAQAALFCWTLEQCPGPKILFTPNADVGGQIVRAAIQAWATGRTDVEAVHDRVPPASFLRILQAARLLVGNSSAGILEAPSFGLPVIDLGDRQKGRLTGTNVIHAPWVEGAIRWAVQIVEDPDFLARAREGRNPYTPLGPPASERITRILCETPRDRRLMEKP